MYMSSKAQNKCIHDGKKKILGPHRIEILNLKIDTTAKWAYVGLSGVGLH